MEEFLDFIISAITAIVAKIHEYTFTVGGIEVSLFSILVGFLVVGFVINFFWKGARG